MDKYLHELDEFPDLLQIIAEETGILATLVEKDYWLMHVLYGLQEQGFEFNLKGGTSLSKGYGAIKRFSEDIDIFIKPPATLQINPKSTSQTQIDKRREFYDQLCDQIKIPGIVSIERDYEFDDQRYYRSGGIRLHYKSFTESVSGLKEGILLEAGFDQIAPFELKDISSWAFEKAKGNKEISIIDNKAIGVPCYHPGYTFAILFEI